MLDGILRTSLPRKNVFGPAYFLPRFEENPKSESRWDVQMVTAVPGWKPPAVVLCLGGTWLARANGIGVLGAECTLAVPAVLLPID